MKERDARQATSHYTHPGRPAHQLDRITFLSVGPHLLPYHISFYILKKKKRLTTEREKEREKNHREKGEGVR